MYCPRCSQPSEDLRYCPGCGFSLTFVHQLLANNGSPTISNVGTAPEKVPLMRRKGFRNGAKLVFISLFLIPVAMIFSIAFDSPGPLSIPLLVFLVGVAISLYTVLFVEPSQSFEPNVRLNPMNVGFNVPVSTPPLALNQPRMNTSEMIRPVSVTEHTTKLLDQNK